MEPENIVRAKCQKIVASAKKDGWDGPPYNPLMLASILGIKVRQVSHDIGAEARIFGKRGQVLIEYRPEIVTIERLRFTICHEIAHTVFPDCFRLPRHYHLSGEQLTPAQREFERLCDVGAGELLMPVTDFTRDLRKKDMTLNNICSLRKRYRASVEAATNRSLGLTDFPCAAVFLNRLRSDLIVKFYWKSSSFNHFIPPGTSIEKSSVAYCAKPPTGIESKPTKAKREFWCINSKTIRLRVEAISLPIVAQNPDYPKVLALVAPAEGEDDERSKPNK